MERSVYSINSVLTWLFASEASFSGAGNAVVADFGRNFWTTVEESADFRVFEEGEVGAELFRLAKLQAITWSGLNRRPIKGRAQKGHLLPLDCFSGGYRETEKALSLHQTTRIEGRDPIR